MALTQIELARVRKGMDAFLSRRRPPVHIRHELDIAYRISGQSIEVFESRPRWRGKPGEIQETPVAKASYLRSRNIWRVYWMRKDLKWHSYEPVKEVRSIDAFCEVVDKDEHCCFFG
jgi:Protein of unknown function (DUF3024)